MNGRNPMLVKKIMAYCEFLGFLTSLGNIFPKDLYLPLHYSIPPLHSNTQSITVASIPVCKRPPPFPVPISSRKCARVMWSHPHSNESSAKPRPTIWLPCATNAQKTSPHCAIYVIRLQTVHRDVLFIEGNDTSIAHDSFYSVITTTTSSQSSWRLSLSYCRIWKQFGSKQTANYQSNRFINQTKIQI